MQVRVLGQVEALDADGSPYPIGGPTQRRVLAALALRRNEVVSVSSLVDVVWPGGEVPLRAEHNIRTYIHRLRTAIDGAGERLETVGAGYRLRLDDDELDAARFERLAGTASRLVSTRETVAALDAIDEAERIWRGEPIEEFRHEDWALADAARIDEVRAELRTRRAEALIDAGRTSDAIVTLGRLTRDEPYRERPRALLMRALYESGRHAEALRAYQDFRRALVEEIGVEPSDELVELDRKIARRELSASRESTRSVGGYELHERIGEGAFAVVHRATQTSVNREVAVKIVRAELANQPEFIRRFEAEAQMIARVEHPNVVPLYDYWREPDRAYLVMRWMTGGSLEALLDDGPVPPERTTEIVDQIAAALDAVHAVGVVHRDVKPENILFDDERRAYLGDFGIALDAQERAHPEAALSEGSPVFAAPEQLRREPAGPEADVHALGIVTFNLLTGRTPFGDATDEPKLLQRQLSEPIQSTRVARPELPEAIGDVVAIATAKDPAARYPTASGFAAALRAATSRGRHVAGERVAVRPRVNPYKGLQAFDESDSATFHGRERLVTELVDQLAEPDANLLALVGPSGSGKSSVVRAGLVPALRADRIPGSSRWFTTTMTPGNRPFEALETALLRVAVDPPAALLEQLLDGERGVLRAVKRLLPDEDGIVAIVIDQFEELFGAGVPERDRDMFLRALTAASTEPASPARFILTLRADFLDRPLRHPGFAPVLKVNTVVITPLAPDELEHAIARPAAAVGVDFEPGLVAEIIADVNHEPGALPLLQYALTQAFDATEGDTITIDAYRAIGGIAGALGRRAEQLHDELDPAEQLTCRRTFGRLVTLGEGTEDTRRRVRRSELGDDVATGEVLDRFGHARLLSFDRDPATRETTVEIAHEALIREWERLRTWLDDDRDGLRIHRHLTTTAVAWSASGCDDGELYRGTRLDAAAIWAGQHARDLNPDEHEFLTASVSARDSEVAAERRRFDEQAAANRRLRRLVAVAVAIAMVALAGGVIALRERSRADASAFDSEVRRLVTRGRTASSVDPTLDLLLALEAHRIAPSSETIDALHWALTARPGFVGSLDTGPIGNDITVLDDGRRIVTHTRDDVQIWDVATREQLASWPAPAGATTAFDVRTAAAGDGSVVVAAGPSETLVWRPDTDAEAVRLEHGVPTTALALSPDVTKIAIGFADGTTAIYELAEPIGEATASLASAGSATPVRDVSWAPTGDVVVASERWLEVWTPAADVPRWRVRGSASSPLLSPDGSEVVAVMDPEDAAIGAAEFFFGSQPVVRIFDLDDGRETGRIVPRSDVERLAWIEDGRLVGASSTGPITRYDVEALVELSDLGSGFGRSTAVAIAPEGDLALVAGTSSIELVALDGSGPLARVLRQPEEVAAVDDPYLTGSFDKAGGSFATAAFPITGSARLHDLTTDTEPSPLDTDPAPIAFRRFGDYVLSVGGQQPDLIVRRDLEGPLVADLDVGGGFFFALSPRGDLFATERGEPEIVVIDVATGDERYRLDDVTAPGFPDPIPEFTPDGRFLHVWNGASAFRFVADTGELVWATDKWGYVFPGPDDEWVATAEKDGSVELRDPSTLEPIGRRLSGHRGLVTQFQYDLASGRAVTTADDGVARVWNTIEGDQLGRSLTSPSRSLRTLAPGGDLLALPGDDGYTIWNYDTATWPDIACEVAGRNLTRAEWDELGPRGVDYRATCEQFPIDE